MEREIDKYVDGIVKKVKENPGVYDPMKISELIDDLSREFGEDTMGPMYQTRIAASLLNSHRTKIIDGKLHLDE